MKPIYTYDSVSDYLTDWHNKVGKHLSFRVISKAVDARSPSYFHRIKSGEKSVPVHKYELFIQLLGLNKAEAKFFIVLATVSQQNTDRPLRLQILNRFLNRSQRLLRSR